MPGSRPVRPGAWPRRGTSTVREGETSPSPPRTDSRLPSCPSAFWCSCSSWKVRSELLAIEIMLALRFGSNTQPLCLSPPRCLCLLLGELLLGGLLAGRGLLGTTLGPAAGRRLGAALGPASWRWWLGATLGPSTGREPAVAGRCSRLRPRTWRLAELPLSDSRQSKTPQAYGLCNSCGMPNQGNNLVAVDAAHARGQTRLGCKQGAAASAAQKRLSTRLENTPWVPQSVVAGKG